MKRSFLLLSLIVSRLSPYDTLSFSCLFKLSSNLASDALISEEFVSHFFGVYGLVLLIIFLPFTRS